MHTGRSHHTAKDVILSLIGGFAASLLTFTVSLQKNSGLQGQLIAGDRAAYDQYPTAMGQMQNLFSGGNPIVQGLSSMSFWVLVIVGGIIASFVLFRLISRYG